MPPANSPKTVLYLIVLGGEQSSRGMPGGAMRSGGRPLAEEPPRALLEGERLTRNPEKLANADGRCWKDTLGRKRSFKTHRPPYPTRRGLVTAWPETKKLLHNESLMSLMSSQLRVSKSEIIFLSNLLLIPN